MGKMIKSSHLAVLFLLLLSTSLAFFPSTISAAADVDDDDKQSSVPVSPSGSDTCSTKLKFDTGFMPFDASSLSCYTAWPSQDFILMYKQGGPGVWSFVLSAPDNNAYISVGFSPNGKMVGSSAVAGWVSSAGKGMARQYYLGGETPGKCEPDKGALKLVDNSTLIASQSSRLYLVFQLKIDQPLAKLIYAVGSKGVLPGPDLILAEHQTMVTSTVNYATGQSSTDSGSAGLQTSHGLLALLGWGVLMPIGILVARHGKRWDPEWFYTHISIQALGFGLGVAGIVTGFKLEDKTSAEVDTHKAIGIVILVCGCLQVLAVLARPDKSSKVRKYWNWYHYYVGRAGVALAVANIFYGLSLAEEELQWKIGYGVFLGVWVLVALFLEVLMCARRK